MIFLKLKYYFSKFKICIYICGVILVLFTFVTLLGQVNLFTRAGFSNPIRYNRNIAWSSCRCCFSLLGSIWVNAQQRKEELNRKRAQEIYRPLYDELVNIHKNILKENPYPSLIEFRTGHQTMKPHPQYAEWRKIELDSRYLQIPAGVEETNGSPVWGAGWLFDETKTGIG